MEIVKKAYSNPKVAQSYGVEFYNTDAYILGENCVMNQFLGLLPANSSILDLGCGQGQETEFIASKGFSVIGIDFANAMLDIAEKKRKDLNTDVDIRYIYGDITLLSDVSLELSSFSGAVYTLSLICLTPEQAKSSLNQTYDLLEPNGHLFAVVQEDNESDSIGRSVVEEEPFDISERQFYKFYTEREIKDLLYCCGFAIERYERIELTNENEAGAHALVCFASKIEKP